MPADESQKNMQRWMAWMKELGQKTTSSPASRSRTRARPFATRTSSSPTGRNAEASRGALDLLAGDERLGGYPFYHAAIAEQLARSGRPDEARAAFERAMSVARSPAEERYLTSRSATCN